MLSGSYLHSLSPLRKEAHTYLSRSKNEETGEMLPASIVNPIVELNSANCSKLLQISIRHAVRREGREYKAENL